MAAKKPVFKKGDTVKCVVLDVDREKQRVGLGTKQLSEDPWVEAIPSAYRPGMIVKGHITKITNFGVFVELEEGLEGLLHISELSDQKVENPLDVVKPGQEVDVKILRVDTSDRKIGLSLKRAQWGAGAGADDRSSEPVDDFPRGKAPTRGGMDDHGALGTDKIKKSWEAIETAGVDRVIKEWQCSRVTDQFFAYEVAAAHFSEHEIPST